LGGVFISIFESRVLARYNTGMAKKLSIIIVFLAIAAAAGWAYYVQTAGPKTATKPAAEPEKPESGQDNIRLPGPQKTGSTSVEKAIFGRRSIRSYRDKPLELREVAQLLWSAQGITAPRQGKRAAPSAGALYPLEVYVVADKVRGLSRGVYHYLPKEHGLEMMRKEDVSQAVAQASLNQMFVADAPAILVITADYSITTQKYGNKGKRYVHMEAGHAAENIYLQAQSLDLGTVTVGAFQENKLKEVLATPNSQAPLYLMPVGKKWAGPSNAMH